MRCVTLRVGRAIDVGARRRHGGALPVRGCATGASLHTLCRAGAPSHMHWFETLRCNVFTCTGSRRCGATSLRATFPFSHVQHVTFNVSCARVRDVAVQRFDGRRFETLRCNVSTCHLPALPLITCNIQRATFNTERPSHLPPLHLPTFNLASGCTIVPARRAIPPGARQATAIQRGSARRSSGRCWRGRRRR